MGHFKSRKERESEFGAKAMKFTNVYIKNFGEEYTDEKLKELFSKFGNSFPYLRHTGLEDKIAIKATPQTGLFKLTSCIPWLSGKTLSVRVMRDERGRSRGFGFVNYGNHMDAQKVGRLNISRCESTQTRWNWHATSVIKEVAAAKRFLFLIPN